SMAVQSADSTTAAAAGKAGTATVTAKKFESVFLTEMVSDMMKTVQLGPMDGGNAEETWRSFLARSMADQIADSGTTGIAQSIERMLKAYNKS
ncbi:hypothetical protein FGG78_29555, partial [Thioclava sp. BHET1]